jgi:hypothetical protein
LEANHPARAWAIRVVFNPWFDRVVMGFIALNCLFLAMDSKAPDFRESRRGCERAPPTGTLPGSVSTRRASADSARSLARSFFSSAPTRREYVHVLTSRADARYSSFSSLLPSALLFAFSLYAIGERLS